MLAWLIGEPPPRAALGLEGPSQFSDEEVHRHADEWVRLFAPRFGADKNWWPSCMAHQLSQIKVQANGGQGKAVASCEQ